MAGYIVVIDYKKKTKECVVVGVSGEPELNIVKSFGVVPYDSLGSLTIQSGFQPLNFDVDRNGNVKQFCSFDRFESPKHAVVLGEILSVSGSVLGYRIITSNGVVYNKRKNEILEISSTLGDNEPFLQNGQISNKSIKCYPLHKFPSIIVNNKARKAKTPEPAKATVPPKAINPVKNSFTEVQKDEFRKAQKHGVDTSFMENPNLNEKQLRVLWLSKSKGVLSEYFAKPEYSVDVMKWYADKLYTKSAVKDRALMLQHPKLSIDQLNELEQCITDGVDYSDICDENIALGEMQVKRIEKTESLWGEMSRTDATDEDIINNVANFINKTMLN